MQRSRLQFSRPDQREGCFIAISVEAVYIYLAVNRSSQS